MLEVKNLSVSYGAIEAVKDISFTVNAGEVLGIAGIAGSGQRELLESIAGLYPITSGSVTFFPPESDKPQELAGKDPMDIRKAGIFRQRGGEAEGEDGGQQSGKHTQGYEKCGHLFHLSYLLVIMCFCPYTRQIGSRVSENGKFAEKFFFFCSV